MHIVVLLHLRLSQTKNAVHVESQYFVESGFRILVNGGSPGGTGIVDALIKKKRCWCRQPLCAAAVEYLLHQGLHYDGISNLCVTPPSCRITYDPRICSIQ